MPVAAKAAFGLWSGPRPTRSSKSMSPFHAGIHRWRYSAISATASCEREVFEGRLGMILGMSTSTFTLVHVVLSLVGIFAGFVVLFGMFSSRKLEGWAALFLATTVLTSVTGFPFPRDHILPSHIVGVISLVVLAIAIFALYSGRLMGSWRWIYVVGAVVAQYLNVFVAVVQSFLKVPALNALAPTQAEPPFIIAQSLVLVIFVVLGILAVRSFHPRTDAVGFGMKSIN